MKIGNVPNSEGLVLDADTLGTDKASVRQHYLANNELVGRVNTLGDMRKAMAKQLPPNFDIQERALRQPGIDPVQFSQNVSVPGPKGKAMGISGGWM